MGRRETQQDLALLVPFVETEGETRVWWEYEEAKE